MFQCQVAKPRAKEASTNHLSLEKLYQDELAQFNTEFLLAALPPKSPQQPHGEQSHGPTSTFWTPDKKAQLAQLASSHGHTSPNRRYV